MQSHLGELVAFREGGVQALLGVVAAVDVHAQLGLQLLGLKRQGLHLRRREKASKGERRRAKAREGERRRAKASEGGRRRTCARSHSTSEPLSLPESTQRPPWLKAARDSRWCFHATSA